MNRQEWKWDTLSCLQNGFPNFSIDWFAVPKSGIENRNSFLINEKKFRFWIDKTVFGSEPQPHIVQNDSTTHGVRGLSGICVFFIEMSTFISFEMWRTHFAPISPLFIHTFTLSHSTNRFLFIIHLSLFLSLLTLMS